MIGRSFRYRARHPSPLLFFVVALYGVNYKCNEIVIMLFLPVHGICILFRVLLSVNFKVFPRSLSDIFSAVFD